MALTPIPSPTSLPPPTSAPSAPEGAGLAATRSMPVPPTSGAMPPNPQALASMLSQLTGRDGGQMPQNLQFLLFLAGLGFREFARAMRELQGGKGQGKGATPQGVPRPPAIGSMTPGPGLQADQAQSGGLAPPPQAVEAIARRMALMQALRALQGQAPGMQSPIAGGPEGGPPMP